ncbi:MAG: DUF4388 domain-containing protein [Candidatus Zixiibacteriota bacterium]
MDLQGNIEKFALVEILQLLATGRKSGTLGIQHDDSIIMIYFEAGDVIYAYGPRETFHLGQLLTERGKITAEQLDEAIAVQARNENTRRLGEILVARGHIDRVDLETVVREQIQELLFSMLSWRTGSFKFYENQFPTKEEITVTLSVENVILEGLRRLDEESMIRETLPDLNQVFRISASQAGRTRAITMKASEWNVLAQIDSYRTVNQICESSPLGRRETMNRIAQLRLAGLIEPAEAKTPPAATNNLEQMIAGLSRRLEEYLTQKTRPVEGGRTVTRTLIEEAISESN